jgi:hypothetical protein
MANLWVEQFRVPFVAVADQLLRSSIAPICRSPMPLQSERNLVVAFFCVSVRPPLRLGRPVTPRFLAKAKAQFLLSSSCGSPSFRFMGGLRTEK